jgi:hypothetical protein
MTAVWEKQAISRRGAEAQRESDERRTKEDEQEVTEETEKEEEKVFSSIFLFVFPLFPLFPPVQSFWNCFEFTRIAL